MYLFILYHSPQAVKYYVKMSKIEINNVYKISKEYKVSLRIAAYISAIDKVAKTYKFRDGSFTFQKT